MDLAIIFTKLLSYQKKGTALDPRLPSIFWRLRSSPYPSAHAGGFLCHLVRCVHVENERI